MFSNYFVLDFSIPPPFWVSKQKVGCQRCFHVSLGILYTIHQISGIVQSTSVGLRCAASNHRRCPHLVAAGVVFRPCGCPRRNKQRAHVSVGFPSQAPTVLDLSRRADRPVLGASKSGLEIAQDVFGACVRLLRPLQHERHRLCVVVVFVN